MGRQLPWTHSSGPQETLHLPLLEMGPSCCVTGSEGGRGISGPAPGLHPLLAPYFFSLLYSSVELHRISVTPPVVACVPYVPYLRPCLILRVLSQVGVRQCGGGPACLCHTGPLTSSCHWRLFPNTHLVFPASPLQLLQPCLCLPVQGEKEGCLHPLDRGFQAQADWLFCFYGYLYASFLTRFLSVCRVCLESAFRSPIPKHMVGARQVACFPRLENGAEAYGLNPSHGTIVRGWQDRVRTEAVVLNAEVIYSLDLHRGKRRRG